MPRYTAPSLLIYTVFCLVSTVILAIDVYDKQQLYYTGPISEATWEQSQQSVDAILAKAPAEHRERCERVLRGKSEQTFAQAWQDWILYRNFFAGKSDGLYLDIGTNDALSISNTFFFDKCLGWEGVCFEMDPQFYPEIRRTRTCKLVENCVLGEAATVQVQGEGAGGHVLNPHRSLLSAGQDGSAKGASVGSGALRATAGNGDRRRLAAHTKNCVGILDELTRLGLRGRTVDFMSIDIEGSEPLVLRCWPWDEVPVRFILIETNKHDSRIVDRFFHRHNYANIATLMGASKKTHAGVDLDNIYARMPGLVLPGGTPNCDAADMEQNRWCAPFQVVAQRDCQAGWCCNEDHLGA